MDLKKVGIIFDFYLGLSHNNIIDAGILSVGLSACCWLINYRYLFQCLN